MAERITANLPSADFSRTEDFYARMGFARVYRDTGWMILERRGVWVEFFGYPDLDPFQSSFSACLRTTDLDALHAEFQGLGLSSDPRDIPRMTPPESRPGLPRMFFLLDPDGSLWRIIEEPA